MTVRRSIAASPVAAILCTASVLLACPTGVDAQAPVSSESNGVTIEGPPPPTAPDVINRDDEGRVTLRAVRTAEPLRIDGELNEAFYRNTAPISNFIQSLPNEGAAPSERTEAWVAFDGSNVYVSARLWDSAPESAWVANEMRRDAPSIELNDQFGVFLDTYYDRRNGVGFFVNPSYKAASRICRSPTKRTPTLTGIPSSISRRVASTGDGRLKWRSHSDRSATDPGGTRSGASR